MKPWYAISLLLTIGIFIAGCVNLFPNMMSLEPDPKVLALHTSYQASFSLCYFVLLTLIAWQIKKQDPKVGNLLLVTSLIFTAWSLIMLNRPTHISWNEVLGAWWLHHLMVVILSIVGLFRRPVELVPEHTGLLDDHLLNS